MHKKAVNVPEIIKLIKSGTEPNIPDECVEDLTNQMRVLTIKDDVS